MKLVEKSQKVIKTFDVDYENGINCEYTTTNDKLTNYRFFSGNTNLTYVEDVESIKNIHWSDHYKVIEKQKKLNITQIKKFNDFDNLIYIGGHTNGMTKDKDGKFISTPIILDAIFSQCYLDIEKKKEKCQEILDCLKKEYITDSKIVEIPHYNQDGSKKHHHTLKLTVKLPDDLYNKFMGKHNYLDDMIKVNIFNFLKN